MQKARLSGIRSSRKEKRMAEFGRIRFAFFALPSLPAPPPLSPSPLSFQIHPSLVDQKITDPVPRYADAYRKQFLSCLFKSVTINRLEPSQFYVSGESLPCLPIGSNSYKAWSQIFSREKRGHKLYCLYFLDCSPR